MSPIPGEFPLKGVAINLCSAMIFSCPLLIYFGDLNRRSIEKLMMSVFATLVVVIAIPPRGWKKPHPYSDLGHLRRPTITLSWRIFIAVGILAACATANAHYLLFGMGLPQMLIGNASLIGIGNGLAKMAVILALRRANLRPSKTSAVYATTRRGTRLRVDVYEPPHGPPHSSCVYFHAGAWIALSKEFGAAPMHWLAGHGVRGYAVEYRLTSWGSENAGIRGCVKDAQRAVEFVRANATTPVFLMGDSSGGLLAFLVALQLDVPVVASWPALTLRADQWIPPLTPADATAVDPPNVFIPSSVADPIHHLESRIFSELFLLFGRRWRGWLAPKAYDFDVASTFSPLDRVLNSTFRPPALILAADRDEVTPFAQVLKFKELYGKHLSVFAFRGDHHGQGSFASNSGRDAILRFLDQADLISYDGNYRNDALDKVASTMAPFDNNYEIMSNGRRSSIVRVPLATS